MNKKIIFEYSIDISGIMCHSSCGFLIQYELKEIVKQFKKQKRLPDDVKLILSAEPVCVGIQKNNLMLESQESFLLDKLFFADFSALVKEKLNTPQFKIVDTVTLSSKSFKVNWLNISINLIALVSIIFLTLVFPPSFLLTLSLLAISTLATALTSRHYLLNFFNNLRHKKWATMSTAISLGFFLSLAHSFYHSLKMPMMHSFSMVFMTFMMPVSVMALVNITDEIKHIILNKSQKMHLKGMNSLFPQMACEYDYYPSTKESEVFAQFMKQFNYSDPAAKANFKTEGEALLTTVLDNAPTFLQRNKNSLTPQMIIKIKKGEAFPVDCLLLKGNTWVNSSDSGEFYQRKQRLDWVAAGAINLGEEVLAYVLENNYNSTINKISFRANREHKAKTINPPQHFIYFYSFIIIAAIVAAFAIPLICGVFVWPLVMQNLIGIIFTICPCTQLLAHQLPTLLGARQLTKKGIGLRGLEVTEQGKKIHTIVFDKTGTLTTGESRVVSKENISDALWKRIYLLEKEKGFLHPLGKAIINDYETHAQSPVLINDIDLISDEDNRGLTAQVQGRKIQVGNWQYLSEAGVIGLKPLEDFQHQLDKGYTPVFAAEDNIYQGVAWVKHEIRKEVLSNLQAFKAQGIKLIMLTGDNKKSALGFNQQYGAIFEEANIHAEKTPTNKEVFIKELSQTCDPRGLCFIGDGFNDAACAVMTSDLGGISCANTSQDKTAFFSDLSLNGSFSYVTKHHEISSSLRKNKLQNQLLLLGGAFALLAFIICYSTVGLAFSPPLSMIIMIASIVSTICNSYRVTLFVDNTLSLKPSWFKRWLASDFALGLASAAALLFTVALLITILTTGTLALPTLSFAAGTMTALSTVCVLSALALVITLGSLSLSFFCLEQCRSTEEKPLVKPDPSISKASVVKPLTPRKHSANPLQPNLPLNPIINSTFTESSPLFK